MRYRELGAPGAPGLRVSEIGLGTREIGGTVWLGEKGEPVPYGLGEADDDTLVRVLEVVLGIAAGLSAVTLVFALRRRA